MDSSELFLATLSDLERCLSIGDDYSMLRASALLRQLLLDKHSLVHQANHEYRLKLRFTVCGRAYRETMLRMGPLYYFALNSIHRSGSLGKLPEEVSLDVFLATPALKLAEQLVTVGNLISISANVLGGVHKGDPKTEREQAIAEFTRVASGSGPTISASQLKPIVLIALEGLQPLRRAIQNT
jgi:hypothetical protein